MSLKRVITLLGIASLLGATEHNLTITLNEGYYYHQSFKTMGLLTIKIDTLNHNPKCAIKLF